MDKQTVIHTYNIILFSLKTRNDILIHATIWMTPENNMLQRYIDPINGNPVLPLHEAIFGSFPSLPPYILFIRLVLALQNISNIQTVAST